MKHSHNTRFSKANSMSELQNTPTRSNRSKTNNITVSTPRSGVVNPYQKQYHATGTQPVNPYKERTTRRNTRLSINCTQDPSETPAEQPSPTKKHKPDETQPTNTTRRNKTNSDSCSESSSGSSSGPPLDLQWSGSFGEPETGRSFRQTCGPDGKWIRTYYDSDPDEKFNSGTENIEETTESSRPVTSDSVEVPNQRRPVVSDTVEVPKTVECHPESTKKKASDPPPVTKGTVNKPPAASPGQKKMSEKEKDAVFAQEIRSTRSYMIEIAKTSGFLKHKPDGVTDAVWRKKSLRQRIAMIAKGFKTKLALSEKKDTLHEMAYIDEIELYREERELADHDFQKLVAMADAFKAGSLNEESLKIYERHIERYKAYMTTYKLKPTEKKTLETYIVAMHHVYSGSTMWSIMSSLNYYYKRYHDFDTKTWPTVRQIMKAVTANHVVKKAAIFEEKEIEEILKRLEEDTRIDPEVGRDSKEQRSLAFKRNNALLQYIGIHMFHYGLCRKSDILRTDAKNVNKITNLDGEVVYEVCLKPVADNTEIEPGVRMGGGKLAKGKKKRKNMSILLYQFPVYMTPYIDRYLDMRSTRDDIEPRFLKNPSPGKIDENVYFQNCGTNKIGGWAEYWAEKLGKDNPKDYSSHSWRRTGSTLMVDSGCTERQLMVGLGHKNVATVREYIDYSKQARIDRSKLLNPTKNAPKETKPQPPALPLQYVNQQPNQGQYPLPPYVKQHDHGCTNATTMAQNKSLPMYPPSSPHFPQQQMPPPYMNQPMMNTNMYCPPYYPMYGQPQATFFHHQMMQQQNQMGFGMYQQPSGPPPPIHQQNQMSFGMYQQPPGPPPPIQQQQPEQQNTGGGHNIYGQNVTVHLHVTKEEAEKQTNLKTKNEK